MVDSQWYIPANERKILPNSDEENTQNLIPVGKKDIKSGNYNSIRWTHRMLYQMI